MALTKTYDAENDRFHYDAGPDGHVVLLGPAGGGPVTLEDGTVYDTTPEVIEVASPEHGAEIVNLIAPTEETE